MSRPDEPRVVADDIRVAEERDGAVLSCRVRGAGLPERLWFRVAPDLAPALAPTGDAFLPPLLLAAMQRGAPLVIEGEVSAALLGSASWIMDIFRLWSDVIGKPMRPVPIDAPARPAERRGAGAGAFFSGGVDSFYTVLRNLARYRVSDARRITHLILVHGFDVALEDGRLFAEVQERLGLAARELGTPLVVVRTNVRQATAGVPWDHAHGTGMAASGLALAGLFHTCYIAGSNSMRIPGAWGTHPGLDPLWSTETLEFVHDGALLGKLVKTALVVQSPVALRTLRVCWENRGGAYNCGRCEKCLRTMVAVALSGALDRVDTLPREIEPQALASLDLAPSLTGLWEDLRQRLAGAGHGASLVAALDRALARDRWRRSRMGRAERGLSRALARIGITPSRIKALDRRLLRGRGIRALHRVTGGA